jgi:hypothetical protein
MQLLAGYSTMPPTAFVLMGNFLSATQTTGISRQAEELKEHLSQLGDMIAGITRLNKYRLNIVQNMTKVKHKHKTMCVW